MDIIQAIAQKLSRDPAAWSRVQSELAQAKDPRARLIELAKEHGMTVEAKALDQAVLAASRELNESELESVAGGFNPQPDPPALYDKMSSQLGQQKILIGLLLPAVQKIRGV
jgi:hypothetical protein